MRVALAMVAFALFQQQQGCQTDHPLPATSIVRTSPYQRFVPAPSPPANMMGVPWAGYFALDTKTGLLCRTTFLDTKKDFDSLPDCFSLSLNRPLLNPTPDKSSSDLPSATEPAK